MKGYAVRWELFYPGDPEVLKALHCATCGDNLCGLHGGRSCEGGRGVSQGGCACTLMRGWEGCVTCAEM